MLVTLLGSEFHNEIVLGTKECKKEFVLNLLLCHPLYYYTRIVIKKKKFGCASSFHCSVIL